MPNITITIPDELKKDMERLPELNWSETVREFLADKVKRALLLKKLDKLLENSELTEEDCLCMGREAKKRMSKRFIEEAA